MRRHVGDTKRCTKCGGEFSLDAFYKSVWGTPQSWCKRCTGAAAKKWIQTNPGSVHTHNRKRDLAKYGMTSADYDSLLSQQDGKCAACGSDRPGGRWNTYFVVDHDHETGRVRGLLCSLCNFAVGHLKNCPARAAGVLRYIIQFNESE